MSLGMVLERESDGAGAPRCADRDYDVLDALRRRDPLAAERLVTRYGDRAYRLASRITGNSEDAEEAVQDAFWTVTRKIDMFRGESAFGSWLYRIVANAAYQKVRSRQSRRHEVPLDEALPLFDERGYHADSVTDWSPAVHDPAVRTELRTLLTSAIDQLPADYRTVLVLREVEGQSTMDIARALGVSIPLVKARRHRARLFLRKRLDQFRTMRDATTVAACA